MVNVSSVGAVNTEKSHDNKNITHIFIKIYISSICLITFVTSLAPFLVDQVQAEKMASNKGITDPSF